MLDLRAGRRIHLVGIGGAGLSAIARILLGRGLQVSGSDLRASELTAKLADEGARIHIGHAAAHVTGAEAVLASSAVPDAHVEVTAARQLGIPVYRRREFMGALLHGADTLAVAGAHGKTTTTAMLAHILLGAGLQPSYIIGGTLASSGVNAAVGRGEAFVIEADEYGNMFHGLSPNLAVVTNVEHDHPDFFATPADMQAAFAQFAQSLADDGALIACADNAGSLALTRARRERGLPALTYGIAWDCADWRADEIRYDCEGSHFRVLRRGVACGEVSLGLPGAHNVLNALAALAAAHQRGVGIETGAALLGNFRNAGRRFEMRGEREGIVVIDDYAHHPTAIRANIAAARQRFPQRQLWVVWQPHTYSRIKQFLDDFIASFDSADRAVITPIYAAREAPIDGIDSQGLAQAIDKRCPALYTPTFAAAADLIAKEAQRPAAVLICSAGDANQIADILLGADE